MEWDNRAFILTAGFFTLLLFLSLFLGFITPLPLPAEQGILINFGDDDNGIGAVEPRPVEKIQKEPEASLPTETTPTNEPEQMTQDFEEAPAVQVKKSTPVKQTETTETKKKTEDKPKEEPKPVVDNRALWGKNRNTESTNSEGEAGGTGNQGDPTGDENTKNRSLGSGMGDGISFSLNGRASVNLPNPEFNQKKEGTVVVQITVDRSGKVINATPGVRGSTTLDSYLLDVAKKAALRSKFNSKDDAPAYQTGTITYVFRLR